MCALDNQDALMKQPNNADHSPPKWLALSQLVPIQRNVLVRTITSCILLRYPTVRPQATSLSRLRKWSRRTDSLLMTTIFTMFGMQKMAKMMILTCSFMNQAFSPKFLHHDLSRLSTSSILVSAPTGFKPPSVVDGGFLGQDAPDWKPVPATWLVFPQDDKLFACIIYSDKIGKRTTKPVENIYLSFDNADFQFFTR